ncbi:MAG: nucleoside-diphosphate kinase [Rickettsiaceae bacterium]|nr:nucleoside-diphosphate kinase [Rickettsiaceae bacterium]
MSTEYTFSMIKPDATKRNITGQINSYFEQAGLTIVAQKRIRLSSEQATAFYYEHRERSFFHGLVQYMISGPVIVQVLKGEDAVAKNRKIMGATNPAQAEEGTIRKAFAENIEANSVHGSDSLESAERELAFFFSKLEIIE